MKFIIAGMLAAAISWAGNRAALRVIGTRVIVATAPLEPYSYEVCCTKERGLTDESKICL